MQLSFNFFSTEFKKFVHIPKPWRNRPRIKVLEPRSPNRSSTSVRTQSPNAQRSTRSSTCSCLTRQGKFLESCTSLPHPGCLGSLCCEVGTKSRDTNNSALATHPEAENEGLSAKVICTISPQNNIRTDRERQQSEFWRVALKLKDQLHFQMRLQLLREFPPDA